jgi:hypothetical protein
MSGWAINRARHSCRKERAMTIQQSILIGAAIIGSGIVAAQTLHSPRYEFVPGSAVVMRGNRVTGALEMCKTVGLTEPLSSFAVPCK